MSLVRLLSSNASDPVNARWQMFGDIIDADRMLDLLAGGCGAVRGVQDARHA